MSFSIYFSPSPEYPDRHEELLTKKSISIMQIMQYSWKKLESNKKMPRLYPVLVDQQYADSFCYRSHVGNKQMLGIKVLT